MRLRSCNRVTVGRRASMSEEAGRWRGVQRRRGRHAAQSSSTNLDLLAENLVWASSTHPTVADTFHTLSLSSHQCFWRAFQFPRPRYPKPLDAYGTQHNSRNASGSQRCHQEECSSLRGDQQKDITPRFLYQLGRCYTHRLCADVRALDSGRGGWGVPRQTSSTGFSPMPQAGHNAYASPRGPAMMNAVAGLRPLQAGEAPQLQPLQHGSGSGKGGQLQRHGSTQAVAGLPTHAQSSPRGGLDRNASTRPSPRQYQQGAAKQLPHCPLPQQIVDFFDRQKSACLLYTSPSPRDS